MKFGKCDNCKNAKSLNKKSWCIVHAKTISLKDKVICAFYTPKIEEKMDAH